MSEGQDLKKKKGTEHKMCVLIFSTNLVETILILTRTERDMIKSVYWSYVQCLLFLTDFNEPLLFSTDFRKILR